MLSYAVMEEGRTDPVFRILPFLPPILSEKVRSFIDENPGRLSFISEIRLRSTGLFSLTVGRKNVTLFGGRTYCCTEEEVQRTLALLCEDSVHTFDETIREGYLYLPGGVRVGVCGHASGGEEKKRSVYRITSLCIRIPHRIFGVCGEILPLICPQSEIFPTLFYSPPGVGKTTVLRDIAASLEGKRIALVDTRGELFQKEEMGKGLVDVLTGYSRSRGIEIATRTLAAQVIICDEIGTREEADAILCASHCGVPLLASAHGSSLDTLLQKPFLQMLYRAGIFRYYIGLTRKEGSTRFTFDVFDAKGEAKK